MNPSQFMGWLQKHSQPRTDVFFEKPCIMGILNVTPDSFFDGGSVFGSIKKACARAFSLIEQGADVIDIGGESTRPGAAPVPLAMELERVIPIIEQIRLHSDICISIDTYKPEVMEAAVYAGANMINDIYALRQPGAVVMAARLSVPVSLMHMQGQPYHMQVNPSYPNGLMAELLSFFEERIEICKQAGISHLILDPGFGFGKLVKNNLQLLYYLEHLHRLHCPILLGVSRKSTLGAVLNKEVNERLIGGLGIAVYAALKGVSILRTHDVDETKQALEMINAIEQAGQLNKE